MSPAVLAVQVPPALAAAGLLAAALGSAAAVARTDRPGGRVEWWGWRRMATGAILIMVGAALGTVPGTAPLVPVLRIAGALWVARGVVGLHSHRASPAAAADVLGEGVLVALAAAALLVAVGAPEAASAGAVAVTVVDLAALWLLARLVGAPATAPRPYLWTLAALVAMVAADATATATDGELATTLTTVLQLSALGCWLVAVTRPDLAQRLESLPAGGADRLRTSHVVLVAVVVGVGVLVLTGRHLGGGIDAPVLALAGGALPVAVVVHLLRQLRTRVRLEQRAAHDPVTALPNRRVLLERLSHELVRARRSGDHVAVVLLDLDGFKHVNDSLGHDVGDELLRAVAQRLRGRVRAADTVARHGGDEFTVVASVHRPADALRLAEDLLAEFREPFPTRAGDIHVGASLGVAVAPDDGDDPAVLLKHADTAMYGAKARGRGRVQAFTPHMSVRADLRLALDRALRTAIAQDDLRVVYQPQVEVSTGRVVGLEALVRWQHPTLGVVPPDAFVPLAEDGGFIDALGRWVRDHACAEVAAWRHARLLDVPVAVNISAVELVRADLLPELEAMLESAGLPAARLVVELTESSLSRDLELAARTVAALRNLGVRIVVDDFGTGYSALRYLSEVPVDGLKVDRSFIAAIGAPTDRHPVAEGILALARGLGLSVVAEGVERPEQVAWLVERGCTVVQGYYIAPPVPGEVLGELLRALGPRRRPVTLAELRAAGLPGGGPVEDGRVRAVLAAVGRGLEVPAQDLDVLEQLHDRLERSPSPTVG